MRILNAKEMCRVEEQAFASGMSELDLMQTAGQRTAQTIRKHYHMPETHEAVLVVCGNGKNGGDGFVIAKELLEAGCEVKIVLADKMPELEQCRQTFALACRAGVAYHFYSEDGEKYFSAADVIVDCVFGIGFHGELKGAYGDIFDSINKAPGKVVAVDVPSGTDATTGAVASVAVQADLTVAITCLKFSHVLPPANGHCGKIKVVSINIDPACFDVVPNCVNTIEKKSLTQHFTPRLPNANKGDFGHLLSVCGSYKMTGAAVIAARAATLSGAGLVTCAFPKSAYCAMTARLVEPLFLPVNESKNGTLCLDSQAELVDAMHHANAMLIGCGMGVEKETMELVKNLLQHTSIPIVLDADGINAFEGNIDKIGECSAPLILTPHPGEMGRLIGEDAAFVQAHRLEVACSFAKDFGVIIVLKGANTVVSDGVHTFINTKGNPGMAKGGTGDMLAGMIGALLAQGMQPLEAAKAAVYIHACVGDICATELSQRGMTVSHMLELLPTYLSEFE